MVPINLQSDERILTQARIHPGIFGLPIVALIVCLVPILPILFIFRMMGNVLGQLNQPGVPAAFSFLLVLPLAVSLVPSLLVLLLALLAYLRSEITLTNKRLIYSNGFLVRAAGELPLENVEAMFILEPILGRLLGYGTVAVSTLGGLRFPLRFIGKPQVFHAALQRAVGDAKAAGRPSPKHPSAPLDSSRYMPRA
jgi:uncharacterized membrane protein YdbT with pleckstrin-like domain